MTAYTAFPKETRPYEPRGHALTVLKSRKREVLLSGPAGTGKSTAWLQKLHICAKKYPGMRALIARKTRHSLTQTAMVTFEKKVLPEGWLGNVVHFRTQEQQYEYPNGSIIAVGGMDKASKVMSSEWDMIYGMEATEFVEEDWESFTTRLRNNIMPYQQLGGDCNPGPPTHWLKLRCDRGACLMLESRHEDNPSVTREYLAALDALTGVRRKRLRDGIWAAAEGLVYEEWNPAVHVLTLSQLVGMNILTEQGQTGKAVKRVVAGVDFGWTNPGCIHVNAVDGDGRSYLIREIYRTHRTIDWWIARARELKDFFGIECFVCDPAEPAFIEQYNAAGLRARAAENSIAPGISALQERLQIAGDHMPRLYVYENALQERDESREAAHQPYCFEQEILEYVWPQSKDGKPVKEVPVKVNDHACDTQRYLAMYLAQPKSRGGALVGIAPLGDDETREGWVDGFEMNSIEEKYKAFF